LHFVTQSTRGGVEHETTYGFNRAEIRIIDRYEQGGKRQAQSDSLELPMRLREHVCRERFFSSERKYAILRMQKEKDYAR